MSKRVGDLRKQIPLRVKLEAALLAAGFSWDEVKTKGAIHFDHYPALALREQIGDDFLPPQHDARFIRPLLAQAHRRKTNGNGATTYGSDAHEIAKTRRLTRKQNEFRERMTAKENGDPVLRTKWPRRKG